MFRKICNYLAVIALSMVVAGNSAANSNVPTVKSKVKSFSTDVSKNQNFYSEHIAGGGRHSYSVKVEAGKQVKIKIHAENNVMLKITSPDGSVKTASADKFFEVALKAEGSYVVEIESAYNSLYTLEMKKK